MNVHRAPRTPAERSSLLRAIADQEKGLLECSGEVACADCGRRVPLRAAYRCFYCLLVFCRACGKRHFGGNRGMVDESVWDLFRAAKRMGVARGSHTLTRPTSGRPISTGRSAGVELFSR